MAAIAKWTAGQCRAIPLFAGKSMCKLVASAATAKPPDVRIWADSFTNHFSLSRTCGGAVLAGSQADRAVNRGRRVLRTHLDHHRPTRRGAENRRTRGANAHPYVRSGVPVVALEPSCVASPSSDARKLVRSKDVGPVADDLVSFAELVEQLDPPLPDLSGLEVVAQPHRHHSAVIGWDTDDRLLQRAGASVVKVPGCCGLAGNFGVERGHFEVSVAIAEADLLPAVRSHPNAVMLSVGMSCRVQRDDLAGVRALHLAELFASQIAATSAE